MALVSCPDCGAQVSDTAVVCPQCGFPLRRDVLSRTAAGRASSGGNTAGIVIGVVAAGLMVVVVLERTKRRYQSAPPGKAPRPAVARAFGR